MAMASMDGRHARSLPPLCTDKEGEVGWWAGLSGGLHCGLESKASWASLLLFFSFFLSFLFSFRSCFMYINILYAINNINVYAHEH